MNLDLGEAWQRLAQPVTVNLQPWQWILITAVVLVLVVPPRVWRITGLYSTLVHELGHIVAALFTGRFVTGLRIGWDHSGEVVSKGRGKASIIVSGIFGYPAPLWVSAVMFWAISQGYAGRALGLYAVLFLVALVFVRNVPALIVCLLSALGALSVVFLAPAESYIYIALILAGFLLGAGLRDFVKLVATHTIRRQALNQSDAYLIARATGTFASLWLVVIVVLGLSGAWWATDSLLGLIR